LASARLGRLPNRRDFLRVQAGRRCAMPGFVLQIAPAPADLAVLRLVEGEYEKQDSTGHTLAFTQRLECLGAYRDGVLIPPADGPDEFRPSPWLTRFGAMPPQEEEKK